MATKNNVKLPSLKTPKVELKAFQGQQAEQTPQVPANVSPTPPAIEESDEIQLPNVPDLAAAMLIIKDLMVKNRDLTADFEALQSRIVTKTRKANYTPTGNKRGLPKGVSKLDFAKWKSENEKAIADAAPGVRAVELYQAALENGTWKQQIFPQVREKNVSEGSGWPGKATPEQMKAKAGLWPGRQEWNAAIDACKANRTTPNYNFNKFLAACDPISLAGQYFYNLFPKMKDQHLALVQADTETQNVTA